MKWFTLLKAKYQMRQLSKALQYKNIQSLQVDILEENEKEIIFRYHTFVGKVLKLDTGDVLSNLIDIYHNETMIKSAFRVNIRKNKSNGEFLEFSRSGTSVPGPC